VFNRVYFNIPFYGTSITSVLKEVRPISNKFIFYYTKKDEDYTNGTSLTSFKTNQVHYYFEWKDLPK